MTGLTYDTGALIAAERGDERVWALHRRSLERGLRPTVPAAVLVEAWRGGAVMARLIAGVVVEPLDAQTARRAGLMHAGAPGAGAVDASVVEGALRRGDTVVTSDRGDLLRIAGAAGRRLGVIDV